MAKQTKKTKTREKTKQKSNKKRKIALLCTLIPLGVAGAGVGAYFGITLLMKNNKVDVDVEGDDKSNVEVTAVKTESGSVEITVKSKVESKEFAGEVEVYIGNTKLEKGQYKVEGNKIIIEKEVIEKNQGKILVKPTLKDKEVTGIKLSESTKSDLKVGASFKIKATLLYGNNAEQKITWSQEPGAQAGAVELSKTESASGEEITVTGKTVGDVALVATCNEKSARCAITIKESTLSKIEITNKPSEVTKSETFKTSAMLTYSNADTINWTQSSADNGKVSFHTTTTESGQEVQVTDVDEGTVTIVATCGDYSDQFNVTVKPGVSPVTDLTVNGSHNVDINDTSTWTFSAKDQDGNDITSSCTFTSSDSDVAYFKDGSSSLTLLSDTMKKGGSITVTAKYNDDPTITNTFDVEFGSFNKIIFTSWDSVIQKDENVEGSIVLPTKAWRQKDSEWKWVAVEKVGNFAASKITSIYYPQSITTIYDDGCYGTGLAQVVVDPKNTTYTSRDKYGNETNCVIQVSSTNGSVVVGCKQSQIPTEACDSEGNAFDVKEIGRQAFKNNDITTINIPETIIKINGGAFLRCSKLSTVNFTGTPTIYEIGDNAFNSCTSLTSIDFPASVTTISRGCFNGSAIEKVYIRNSDPRWIQKGDSKFRQIDISNETTNAEYLKNVPETAEFSGTDWGATGITFDYQAALSASVTCDTSFATAGITLGSYTTEVRNKIKTNEENYRIITIPYTKPTADIKGTITVTNKATKVIKTESVTFDSTEGKDITIEITDWTNITCFDELTLSFTKDVVKQVTIKGDTNITQGNSVTYSAEYGGGAVTCSWSIKETLPDDGSVALVNNTLKIREHSDPSKTYTLVATPADSQYTAAEATISITQCGPEVKLESGRTWVVYDEEGAEHTASRYYYNKTNPNNVRLGVKTSDPDSTTFSASYKPESSTATELLFGSGGDFEVETIGTIAKTIFIKWHITQKSPEQMSTSDTMPISVISYKRANLTVYDEESFSKAGLIIDEDYSSHQIMTTAKVDRTIHIELDGQFDVNGYIVLKNQLSGYQVWKSDELSIKKTAEIEVEVTDWTSIEHNSELTVVFESSQTIVPYAGDGSYIAKNVEVKPSTTYTFKITIVEDDIDVRWVECFYTSEGNIDDYFDTETIECKRNGEDFEFYIEDGVILFTNYDEEKKDDVITITMTSKSTISEEKHHFTAEMRE